MGKKKFIDKKKSATFQLLARDSSHPSSSTDRVFVRVDNNPYSAHGFEDGESEYLDSCTPLNDDSNSIFNDAPEDADFEEEGTSQKPENKSQVSGGVHDHVRREILELGLPDDGYNYLTHLREIKNTGGGSAYYHNSKAKLDRLPLDVKAYDASRVRVNSDTVDDVNCNSIYSVSERTVGVIVQKAVDPDVAVLLDETDSRFNSDVDELEEDFVVQANFQEEAGEDLSQVRKSKGVEIKEKHGGEEGSCLSCSCSIQEVDLIVGDELGNEKPRVRRLLDEQFDLLTLRQYDSDHYSDDDDDDACFQDEEDESLADNLKHAHKDFQVGEKELDCKYQVPVDALLGRQTSSKGEVDESLDDVITKCREYAETYEDESDGVVVVQESSDESEQWDCETIISTYLNLDNHPKKIEPPIMPKRKLVATLSGDPADNSTFISLSGKEKLPVGYLPHSKRGLQEKVKKVANLVQQSKSKPHVEESKEEKKEWKAAVIAQRREARRAKKNLKGLYRCEAQRAQKVAATTGPGSIHLI
ncbi:uncharacterized protein [Aristolochia californica]|uniref:uncharacterized protein n=1 Tax=Aristolochia californica TaxID=171875 RepID=UPI0035DBE369